MKISYQWLKDYLNTDLSPEEVSTILTSTGLEVSDMTEFQSVKGGLKGLVIGEVITCEKHPDADKLSLTTVNVGGSDVLSIVCGAPNVAAGQKVVVATVGTELYGDEGSFTIKKSKIRGQLSEGMLCAEDEIGLGKGHEGILVLPHDVQVGIPASEYFHIATDLVFEVDLTANRIDAASHIGVARDLAAALSAQGNETHVVLPSIEGYTNKYSKPTIQVRVENTDACIRYAGIMVTGIEVKESPDWLKNKLKAIGLKPINNIVDITNFILHECAQPLHAFDAHEVGNEIIVKTVASGTKITTLDGVERILDERDLMICNSQQPLCIAGVFGGLNSGVSEKTTSVFIECACFHPVSVRKTARRHGLNTDSSFRFERGVDPNNTIYVLKRAALLVQELAGGTISEPVDIYPHPVMSPEVEVRWNTISRLIGKDIPQNTVKDILTSLEMRIISENENGITVAIPTYRVDVTREVDVIEDLLRIYGYNNIEIPSGVKSTLTYVEKPNPHQSINTVSDMLTSVGFNEIMCNSLTKESYYINLKELNAERCVKILNPLSSDLNVMRQSLVFGGLESIVYNQNRKQPDLKLYEFGNCYFCDVRKSKDDLPLSSYTEEHHLGIWLTGKKTAQSWVEVQQNTTFFELKAYVGNVLQRIGVQLAKLGTTHIMGDDIYDDALFYTLQDQVLVTLGRVKGQLLKTCDINSDVFYADIHWDRVFKLSKQYKLKYQEIAKFPEVKRDLSLLIDMDVSFEDLERAAFRAESKLLKKVGLFDVYEGKNLPQGKKSYALSFVLQDNFNTLVDKQIEKVMKKITQTFEQEFGAQLR